MASMMCYGRLDPQNTVDHRSGTPANINVLTNPINLKKPDTAFISAALPFADFIKNGVSLLTGGSTDLTLQIGLSTSMH